MPTVLSNNMQVADEDDVIYSGYYIDWEYLQILVAALRPGFPERMASRGRAITLDDCVGVYDQWRSELSDEDKTRIPQLLLSFKPEDENERDPAPDRVRYFFPTRFLDAAIQLCVEEYPEAMIEREDDIARRDEMVALLKERHDFEADMSRIHFGCFMDPHPDVAQLTAGL